MAEAGGRAAPLTVGDHDAANHGAKHHRQGERLEAQRRHVAPGSEGPVFLLQGRKRKEGFEMREPHPLLPASPSEPARALCGGPSRPRAMGCGPAACPEAQATPPSACEPALRLRRERSAAGPDPPRAAPRRRCAECGADTAATPRDTCVARSAGPAPLPHTQASSCAAHTSRPEAPPPLWLSIFTCEPGVAR